MLCQQQLIALVYALLGPYRDNTGCLRSMMDRSSGNHNSHGNDCWKHSLANLTRLTLSKTNSAGQGYTVSLNCPSPLRIQTTFLERGDTNSSRSLADKDQSQLNLTLTLGIPNDQNESLQRCESLAEAVGVGETKIFRRQLITRENNLALLKWFQEHHKLTPTRKIQMEHSDPRWMHRGHDSNEHPQKPLVLDSQTRKYKEIVDYILSALQRRAESIREQMSNKTVEARAGPNCSDCHVEAVRKNSFSRRSRCLEEFCEGFDWSKICVSEGKFPVDKELCEMCYPRRDEVVIEQHFAIQEIRERQVFYGVCILLGCAILLVTSLYALRSFCRRLRRRYLMFRSLWGPRSSQNSVTKSRSSSVLRDESTPALFAGQSFNRRLENLQRKNNSEAMEADDLETSRSIMQWRWQKLGAYRKDGRKMLRDIFDIESLKEKPAESLPKSDRIPVLPRAPNASIRLHLKRTDLNHSSELFNHKGLESNDHGSVIA